MRLTLLTTILLTAASLAHARDMSRSRVPELGNLVFLRGTDRGPGRPPVVNATVAWDDFVALYTAIAQHDWDKPFELRQDRLLLGLPAGSSAFVLDFAVPGTSWVKIHRRGRDWAPGGAVAGADRPAQSAWRPVAPRRRRRA